MNNSRTCAQLPVKELAFTNRVYVSPQDPLSEEKFVQIKNFVYSVDTHPGVEPSSVGLNKFHRLGCRISNNESIQLTPFREKAAPAVLVTGSLMFTLATSTGEFSADELTERMLRVVNYQHLTQSQSLVLDVFGVNFVFQCTEIMTLDGSGANVPVECGLVSSNTSFVFRASSPNLKIIGQRHIVQQSLFKDGDFNFSKLGIGGLDTQFQEIFRRAFSSRVVPPDVVERLGIKHVKGMLLHGPPGTGKTLIARQIGKVLNAHDPKVVNGPEILSKYVGESEGNIRKLFEEADKEEKEKGPESQLHIIIFDEIDAVCKQRGSVRDGSGVHDTIVNQLLTKIDGVDALNNILLIGMTNRKDMLDEALLRPGRLEVQVEIGLPDEHGRIQILNIHTQQMRSNNFLGQDVVIEELAKLTQNYTGAEIEGLVKSATSFAVARQVDAKNLNGQPIRDDEINVSMQDFMTALQEVRPALGVQNETLSSYMQHGIVNYGVHFTNSLLQPLNRLVFQLKNNPKSSLVSALLTGPSGTGKSALAVHIASLSDFPMVKVISAQDMVGHSEASKVSKISKIFEDAYKSPLSFIILDDIERLLEYVHIGPRFSNTILQTLLVLIKKNPPPGHQLCIFGTSSLTDVMSNMSLTDAFNVALEVPLLDKDKIQQVLIQTGSFSAADVANAATLLPDPKISIKRLFLMLDMAGINKGQISMDMWDATMQEIGHLASDWAKS